MRTMLLYTLLFYSAIQNTCLAQGSTLYMPDPRLQFRATTIGEVIYFGPGNNNMNPAQTIMAYMPRTNKWHRIVLPGIGRINPTMLAASDGKLYLAGGHSTAFNPIAYENTVDIYDPRSNLFSTASLSEARLVSAAVQVGDLLLFAGGKTSSSPELFSNRVDVYNLKTKIWTKAALSQARVGIAAGATDEVAIFAGGNIQGNRVTDIVDVYQAKTDSWTSLKLSEAKSDASCVVMNNKAYIIGGCFENGLASDKVEIIDLQTLTMVPSKLRISKPRCGSVTNVVGENIIVAAGGVLDFQANVWYDSFRDVDIINPNKDIVTREQLDFDRVNHAGAVFGEKLYVAGGLSIGNALENIREVEVVTSKITRSRDISRFPPFVKVYPNPAIHESIVIEIPEEEFSESLRIQLFDQHGRVMLQQQMNSPKMQIPILDLPKGVYTVSLIGPSKSLSTLIVLL